MFDLLCDKPKTNVALGATEDEEDDGLEWARVEVFVRLVGII